MPTLEDVCPSRPVQHVCPRSQVQVIRVIEDERDSKGFDLLGCQSLDRSLGCDWHKRW